MTQMGTVSHGRRQQPRSTWSSRPASRNTCNCWRIPAPCFLFTGLSRTCRPAPCNSVIYGVVGMEFFQFAGEMGRARVSRASRARRSASRRTLGVEDVRNGTLPTATGTVALPTHIA